MLIAGRHREWHLNESYYAAMGFIIMLIIQGDQEEEDEDYDDKEDGEEEF